MTPNPNELTQQAADKLSAWLTAEGLEHTVGKLSIAGFSTIHGINVIVELSSAYKALITVDCPHQVRYSIRMYTSSWKSAEYLNPYVQGAATGVEGSVKRAITYARDKISNEAEDLSNEIKSTMESSPIDIDRIKAKYQYQLASSSGQEYTINSDQEADEFVKHYTTGRLHFIRKIQQRNSPQPGKYPAIFSPWRLVYDKDVDELADLSSEISSLGESVRSLTE